MTDQPTLPVPSAGGEKKKTLAAPLHPCIDLEGWAKEVDIQRVIARMAKELEARGLNDTATIRRNPQQLVTIIQQALGIEAARLINYFLKEE